MYSYVYTWREPHRAETSFAAIMFLGWAQLNLSNTFCTGLYCELVPAVASCLDPCCSCVLIHWLRRLFHREYAWACLNKYITMSFMAADVFAYVRIGTMERRSSPREERLSILLSSLGSCIRCVSGKERQHQDAFLSCLRTLQLLIRPILFRIHIPVPRLRHLNVLRARDAINTCLLSPWFVFW